MLETFTPETFAKGDRVTVRAPEAEPIELELIDVQAVAGDATKREPFSILFRGPADPTLAQGTFAIEHPRVGSFELFLVPIGSDDDGMRYEAIFT